MGLRTKCSHIHTRRLMQMCQRWICKRGSRLQVPRWVLEEFGLRGRRQIFLCQVGIYAAIYVIAEVVYTYNMIFIIVHQFQLSSFFAIGGERDHPTFR